MGGRAGGCAPAARRPINVLCCSQTAADRFEVRPSGVTVTFCSIRTPVGRGRLGLLTSSLRYDRALARHLDANPRVGLIHAHFGIPDAIVAHRQAKRMGLPLVVTLHGDDAFRVLPRKDPIGGAVRRAVTGARAVICVSGAMAANAVRTVLPAIDPVVIPNGFDDRSLWAVGESPRDLGLLFVGLFVPVKNLDILLRAYARVRDRIAGIGSPLPGMARSGRCSKPWARDLGIASSVDFLGVRRRDEVAALMQRATALILPSRSEGWPLVIAESLACGTPVVASRVGGIPEMIVLGRRGRHPRGARRRGGAGCRDRRHRGTDPRPARRGPVIARASVECSGQARSLPSTDVSLTGEPLTNPGVHFGQGAAIARRQRAHATSAADRISGRPSLTRLGPFGEHRPVHLLVHPDQDPEVVSLNHSLPATPPHRLLRPSGFSTIQSMAAA